jgi:hypothetical protein
MKWQGFGRRLSHHFGEEHEGDHGQGGSVRVPGGQGAGRLHPLQPGLQREADGLQEELAPTLKKLENIKIFSLFLDPSLHHYTDIQSVLAILPNASVAMGLESVRSLSQDRLEQECMVAINGPVEARSFNLCLCLGPQCACHSMIWQMCLPILMAEGCVPATTGGGGAV